MISTGLDAGTWLADMLTERLAQGLAPSLAVAAWRNGEPLVSYLAGDSDGSGIQPRLDTAYRIASCTKSFTAAALLILRERGLLSLDDEISTFLPGLRIVGSAVPTLRMLLSMSSGLPTDNPWADRQESLSVEQMQELMSAGVRLAGVPGSDYQYSNLGYALLGQVIRKLAGMPYQNFVEAELLHPLGLLSTGFDSSVPAAGGVARGFRKLAHGWQLLPFSAPGEFSAIGGLFSTLEDLGRWGSWLAAAFDEEPEGGQADQVLSRAARREMQQIHQLMPLTPPDGSLLGYGYGLMVQQSPVHGRIIYHSGGYPGFSSQFRWHPGSATVLAGFENASYANVGVAVAAALEELLAGELLAREAHGDQGQFPGAEPWPEALAIRAVVERLVRGWDDSLARSIFAENVELDIPMAERRGSLAGLLEQLGPLLEEPGSAGYSSNPAQLEWTMPATRGRLKCSFSLSPLDAPEVQELEFSAVP